MVDHAPPTIEASYDKASLWYQNKCLLYGIAGYPLLREFEYIEVYGNTWSPSAMLVSVPDSQPDDQTAAV